MTPLATRDSASTVDGRVLDAIGVPKARELRKTHSERLLAALEAGALAAARAGELALGAAAGGGAVAGRVAATNALAVLPGALCGAQIIELHLGDS
jgi:hypothetical protein